MRHAIIAALAIMLGTSLSAAAGGAIQLKNGKSSEAYDITAETISGVIWETEKDRPGTKVQLWDLEGVQYKGNAMDEFNGLARRLSGGLGARLSKDANSVIGMNAPAGFDGAQWARIKVSALYYLAMADFLNKDWSGAVAKLENYIKEAEKTEHMYDKNVATARPFASKVSGKSVTNAGGLNRFYLDALENLGVAYVNMGDARSANEKAFKPLQELTENLATTSKRYYDWALRALRASARSAHALKDYAGARAAYQDLLNIAVKSGGDKSRAAYEAKLNIGFTQILEGDTRGAQANFYEAIKNWKAGQNAQNTSPPARDWLAPDEAYLTAGSFLGQGLVESAGARSAEDWAKALENFSTSLSIFNADNEIRSKALLGAANACAKLAEASKADKAAAKNHATLAEKYLAELTSLLSKTLAAEDDSIPEIQKTINAYKGD